MKKIIKILFFSVVSTLILCLVVLQFKEVQRYLFLHLADAFESKTGYSLEIADFQISLPLNVRVYHLEIKNKNSTLLKADEGMVAISIYDLINNQLRLNALEFKNLFLHEESFSFLKSDQEQNRLTLPLNLKIDRFFVDTAQLISKRSFPTLDNVFNIEGALSIDQIHQALFLEAKFFKAKELKKFFEIKTSVFIDPQHQTIEGNGYTLFAYDDCFGELQGTLILDHERTLSFFDIHGNVNTITFKGDISIDRDLKFKGSVLNFQTTNLETLTREVSHLEGSLFGSLHLEKEVLSPLIHIEINSPEVTYLKNQLKDISIRLDSKLNNTLFGGAFFVNFRLQNHPLESSGEFELTPGEKIHLNNFFMKSAFGLAHADLSYEFITQGVTGTINGAINHFSLINQLPIEGSFQFKTLLDYNNQDQQIITLSVDSNDSAVNQYKLDVFSITSTIKKNSTVWPLKIVLEGKNFNCTGYSSWFYDLDVFDFQLTSLEGKKDLHRFFLENPSHLEIGSNKICLSSTKFIVGDGWLRTALNYSNDTFQSDLELKKLPLNFFTDAIHGEAFSGLVSGKAEFTQSNQKIIGSGHAYFNEIVLKNELLGAVLPSNCTLFFEIDPFHLMVNAFTSGKDLPPIRMNAKIPLVANLNPLKLNISHDQPVTGSLKASGSITPLIELFALEDFIVTGQGEVDLNLTGSAKQPLVQGKTLINKGTIESFALGTTLSDISAIFDINDSTITMNSFSAYDDHGGSIHGQGSINLFSSEGTASSLNFNIENCQILNIDNLKGAYNGSIEVIGNLNKIKIKGDLDTIKMEYMIAKKIDEVSETVDVIYVNQSPEESPPTTYSPSATVSTPVEMDINVNIPNTLEITDNDLKSKWKGGFILGGNFEKLSLKGDLILTKGDYIISGQQYELRQGNITFAGDVEKKTNIYVVASRDIDDYRVDVVLQGNVANPNIILRSSPSLPQQEVLSLILFGKSPSEISTFQDQQLEQSLSTLLKDQSAGPGMVSKLQKSIGIDRIDINRPDCYSNSDDISIKFGKYITRGLYISLNKGFGGEPTRVALEANLKNDLKVQIDAGESSTSSDNASGQISLLWKHDY